jgi:hypothetical protein
MDEAKNRMLEIREIELEGELRIDLVPPGGRMEASQIS